MKKILPFDDDPIIKSYPHYSFMCSMLQTKEQGMDWIYQIYTQISAYSAVWNNNQNTDFRLGFYPFAGMGDGDLWNICPFIDKMTIPRQFLLQQKDHIAFIKYWLNKGWYLSMYLDEFFREDIQQVGVYYHPIFIYGYDDEEKIFYCADCFENWKYGTKKVTYNDFNIASKQNYNCDGSNNGIQLYMLKDAYIDGFSIKFFNQELKDYLNSSMDKEYYYKANFPYGEMLYSKDGKDKGWYDFGESALKAMLDVLIKAEYNYPNLEQLKFLLLPDFVFLNDYVILMQSRYQWMCQNSYISSDNSIEESLNNLIKSSEIMRNFFLKFTMTGNKNTLYRLQDNFRNFSNNLSDLIRAFENKTKGDTLLW